MKIISLIIQSFSYFMHTFERLEDRVFKFSKEIKIFSFVSLRGIKYLLWNKILVSKWFFHRSFLAYLWYHSKYVTHFYQNNFHFYLNFNNFPRYIERHFAGRIPGTTTTCCSATSNLSTSAKWVTCWVTMIIDQIYISNNF